jgi:hypothetical protein
MAGQVEDVHDAFPHTVLSSNVSWDGYTLGKRCRAAIHKFDGFAELGSFWLDHWKRHVATASLAILA